MRRLLFIFLFLTISILAVGQSQSLVEWTRCSGQAEQAGGIYTYEVDFGVKVEPPFMKEIAVHYGFKNFRITGFTYEGISAGSVHGFSAPMDPGASQANIVADLVLSRGTVRYPINGLKNVWVAPDLMFNETYLTTQQVTGIKNTFGLEKGAELLTLNLSVGGCSFSDVVLKEDLYTIRDKIKADKSKKVRVETLRREFTALVDSESQDVPQMRTLLEKLLEADPENAAQYREKLARVDTELKRREARELPVQAPKTTEPALTEGHRGGNGRSEGPPQPTDTRPSAEQIMADYRARAATDAQAQGHMASGDFKSAAQTYAAAGRQNEAMAAVVADGVVQTVNAIGMIAAENRARRMHLFAGKLKDFAEYSTRFAESLERGDYREMLRQNEVLDDYTSALSFAGRKFDRVSGGQYEGVLNKIRADDVARTRAILATHTEQLLEVVGTAAFAPKFKDYQWLEDKDLVFHFNNKKLSKQDRAHNEMLWKLIDEAQKDRTEFLLEYNRKHQLLTDLDAALIYCISNFRDPVYDREVVGLFDTLADAQRDELVLAVIVDGASDGPHYHYETRTTPYSRYTYDKLRLLLDAGKGYNYYRTVSRADTKKPIYEWLIDKYKVSLDHALIAPPPNVKSMRRQLKDDRKRSGMKPKAFAATVGDCRTIECVWETAR